MCTGRQRNSNWQEGLCSGKVSVLERVLELASA
jgi:hypothetical protein